TLVGVHHHRPVVLDHHQPQRLGQHRAEPARVPNLAAGDDQPHGLASYAMERTLMRIEQTFSVARPPEVVFDYLTDPAKLAEWQTSKTSVEQITDGPVGLGTRVRER